MDIDALVAEGLEKAEGFFKNSQFEAAELLTVQILKVRPDHQKAKKLLGATLYKEKKYYKAIDVLERGDLNDPEVVNLLSMNYWSGGEHDKALDYIEKAIELDPDNIGFKTTRALQTNDTGNAEAALKFLESLPEDSDIYKTMGLIRGSQKRLSESVGLFKKAIELNPDNHEAHVDMAYALFLMGQSEEAWREYEHRLYFYEQMDYFKALYWHKPMWDGSDLTGKRIVVYCEQGLGDFIQFSRYLPELASRGGEVLLHADHFVSELLKENNFTVRTGHSFRRYDYHCSLVSLPYLLKIEPPSCPYLSTKKKADLSPYKNYFKIGIVWGGNPQHPNDQNRSCFLHEFKPVHDLAGVKLFSLQKDLRLRGYPNRKEPVDLAEGCADMSIVNMAPFLTSLTDTAAIIKELDLVITVDTSALHLTGAMGKPVFGMIAYSPDWRWTDQGETSIWYPSLRLFRQKKPGDWAGLFSEVTNAVTELTSGSSEK